MDLMARGDTRHAREVVLQDFFLEVDNHCVVVNGVGLCMYRLFCPHMQDDPEVVRVDEIQSNLLARRVQEVMIAERIYLSQGLMLVVKVTSCANFHLHSLASDHLYEVVSEIVVCS